MSADRYNAIFENFQQGQYVQVQDLVDTLLPTADKQYIPYLLNIAGASAFALKNYAQARDYWLKLVQVAPDFQGAHSNLANAYRFLNHLDNAELHYREALELNEQNEVALSSLGYLLKSQKKWIEAHKLFFELAKLKPKDTSVLLNLAEISQNLGEYDQAVIYAQKALDISPSDAEIHYRLGVYYWELQNWSQAEQYFQSSLLYDAKHLNAYLALGNLWKNQHRLKAAKALYQRAIQAIPNDPKLHSRLGHVLAGLSEYEQAATEFDRVCEINSDYPSAKGFAIHMRLQACHWHGLDDYVKQIKQEINQGKQLIDPLTSLALPQLNGIELRDIAHDYVHCSFKDEFKRPPLVEAHKVSDQRILKVGYFSPDFGNHPITHLIKDVLLAHDPKRIELYLFSYGERGDEAEQFGLKGAAHQFISLQGKSSLQMAQIIAAHQIDILVDLAGYTRSSRADVLALRPAPIIVSWLGFVGTLGDRRLADYIIGDPVVTPESLSHLYSESIVQLPGVFQPNAHWEISKQSFTREDMGLPNDAVVLCSFNQAFKLNPDLWDDWCSILKQAPKAVLWLAPLNAQAQHNLLDQAKQQGLDANRIVFAQKLPLAEHRARIGLADLALDTYPYGSGTTASDTLRSGVPLLTRMGESFASRMAGSLLLHLGLPELIVQSRSNFVQKAVDLIAHPEDLRALKTKLSRACQDQTRFDPKLFAHKLEKAYEQMWQRKMPILDVELKVDDNLSAKVNHLFEDKQYDEVLSLVADNQSTDLKLLNLASHAAYHLKRWSIAEQYYYKLTQLQPLSESNWFNLAQVFRFQNKIELAENAYQKALDIHPKFTRARIALANLYVVQKNHIEAKKHFEQILAQDHNNIQALNDYGCMLLDQQDYSKAQKIFEQLLQSAPHNANGYFNLGLALMKQGVKNIAEIAYRKAIEYDPHFARPYFQLANLLHDKGELEQAQHFYEKLVQIQPSFIGGMGSVLATQAKRCDWSISTYANTDRIREQFKHDHPASVPFVLISFMDFDAQDQRKAAEIYVKSQWGSLSSGNNYLLKHSHNLTQPRSGQRLKIAYLSADFYDHATSRLMVEMFELHDRQRFEIYGISFGPDQPSLLQTRVRQSFEHFIDARTWSDRDIAQWMLDKQIDIAVDLKGFTSGSRFGIFLHKSVPIQVNYLGYPGTLGHSCIDYILGDQWVTPFDASNDYSEAIVQLPHSYQVNDRHRVIGVTPTRAELGLPEDAFVFCSFNNNYKITPKVYDIWMRLLDKVPNSVLWLLSDNPDAENNLKKQTIARGIDEKRVIFAARASLSEHLARQRCADLFLDTWPCNAHTTCSDALWAGLPVLTCTYAKTFAGRVGASLLQAVNLPELITDTPEAYEEAALNLANNRQYLSEIKNKLGRQLELNPPLFDTPLFVKHIEQAFEHMWANYESGQAPKAFRVECLDNKTIAEQNELHNLRESGSEMGHTIKVQTSEHQYKFDVLIAQPKGYAFSAAFDEVAHGIAQGLRENGHFSQVRYVSSFSTDSDYIPIIFAAHLLPDEPIPANAIIYNLEQINSGSRLLNEKYLNQLKNHIVWDYSQRNIQALKQKGVNNIFHVPIGYAQDLDRFKSNQSQDIDILFYGSVNQRRKVILDQLRERGLKVVNVVGLLGKQRDELIARAKLVLNMHFYPTFIFEIVRVSYLLNNSIAVVSELNSNTEIYPLELKDAIEGVPYEGLVDACESLIHNENRRLALVEKSKKIFQKFPQSLFLKSALAVLGQLQSVRGKTDEQLLESCQDLFNRGEYSAVVEQLKTQNIDHHFDLLNLLAKAHNNLKQWPEAIFFWEKTLKIRPSSAANHFNVGNACFALDQLPQARIYYEKAIKIRPDFSDALFNLAAVLGEMRLLDECEQIYRKLIKQNPTYASAYTNLAGLVLDQGKADEAEALLKQAIALNSKAINAYNNLANLYKGQNRFAEAKQMFDQVLSLNPNYVGALGGAVHCAVRSCAWEKRSEQIQAISERIKQSQPVVIPFTLLGLEGVDPQLQLKAARNYVSAQWQGLAHFKGLIDSNAIRVKNKNERINIAYLSADFHHHATSQLMAEMLELHDRQRFKVYGISFGPDRASELTHRVRNAFESFVDVRQWSDEQVARWMLQEQIDIAIDLKGFTADSRFGIFLYKGAPIQVNYLGYPGSLGHPCIDYIIGDRWVTPFDQQSNFSERIVQMPHSYQVNDRKRSIAQTPTRKELGLPENAFVFCSFNNNYKITPYVYDVWMRLLQAIPNSVLWLLSDNQDAEQNLKSEAQKRGVSSDRIVFAPRAYLPNHLARHRCADLFLDTWPCNAHTTCSDALWTGLPVLTCTGETFASRVAASLLDAVGLTELITDNPLDYEQKALALAKNPQLLNQIKDQLQQGLLRQDLPLFDTPRFVKDIEAAYEQMWNRYQAGLKPQEFAVVENESNIGGLQRDALPAPQVSNSEAEFQKSYQTATQHFYQGQFEHVLSSALDMQKLAPDNSLGFLCAGIACIHLARYGEAKQNYQTLYDRGVRDVTILDGLAHACFELGEMDNCTRFGLAALEMKDRSVQVVDVSFPPRRSFSPTTPEKNIIAFSLYGDNSKYCETAYLNVQTQQSCFPSWTCRFYVDESVPMEIKQRLQQAGAQVIEVSEEQKRRLPGTMWRFLAIDDPSVDFILFRDSDSLISKREFEAVQEWLDSPYYFHMMRDYGSHTELILAGMWGMAKGALSSQYEKMCDYVQKAPHPTHVDQNYLREHVWAIMRHSLLQHDRCFGFLNAHPFKSNAIGSEHIGDDLANQPIVVSTEASDGVLIDWVVQEVATNALVCHYRSICTKGKLKLYLPKPYIGKIQKGIWKINFASSVNKNASET